MTRRIRAVPSRPGSAASRIIGPIAVESDDAPFDAIACADHAAVLDDGAIDLMSLTVGNQDGSDAVAPRDRARGPRLPSDLLDCFESDDCEGRIPEPALLRAESRHDLVERSAVVAERHIAVVSRTRHPEILFEPGRSSH